MVHGSCFRQWDGKAELGDLRKDVPVDIFRWETLPRHTKIQGNWRLIDNSSQDVTAIDKVAFNWVP